MSHLSSADAQRFLDAALHAARRAGSIHRQHYRRADLAVEKKSDGTPVTLSDRGAEEAIREHLRRATPELGLLGEEFGAEGSERDRWIIDPLDGTKNFVSGLPYFAILIGLELDGELQAGVVHAPVLGTGDPELEIPFAEGELGESWWAVRGQGAFAGRGTARTQPRPLRVSVTSALRQAFVTHGGLRRIQEHGSWDRFSSLVAKVSRTRGFGDWWGHMLVAEGRCDAMFEAAVALHDVAAVKVIVEEAGGAFRTFHNAPLATDFSEAVLSSNGALVEELAGELGF
jgi:histidinol-phosphatase